MENRKNANTVKVLFKIKGVEKQFSTIAQEIKLLKCERKSFEDYSICSSIYTEACSYIYECSGFIKARYFEETLLPISKTYMIDDLFIPGYKKFLLLRQSLSSLSVLDLSKDNLDHLKSNIDSINNSLSDILSDLHNL